MLKLEKTAQRSGFTVRLREKEPFFESRLLIALAIAIFLHCGALIIFHVTPFSLSSRFLFPPVNVLSDRSENGVSVIASSSLEGIEDFSAPPLSFIPHLSSIVSPIESILNPNFAFALDAFQLLEENVRPQWNETLPLPLEERQIQMTVAGDLAELPLVIANLHLNKMIPFSPQLISSYVAFNVQIDGKTGELFWYEKIESSGNNLMDSLIEKILLDLRFESLANQESFITGTLHFTILGHLET